MRSPWIEMSCAGTLFSMVRSEAAMIALQITNFRFAITMHARRRLLARVGMRDRCQPRVTPQGRTARDRLAGRDGGFVPQGPRKTYRLWIINH
jgi:hypothetical protein